MATLIETADASTYRGALQLKEGKKKNQFGGAIWSCEYATGEALSLQLGTLDSMVSTNGCKHPEAQNVQDPTQRQPLDSFNRLGIDFSLNGEQADRWRALDEELMNLALAKGTEVFGDADPEKLKETYRSIVREPTDASLYPPELTGGKIVVSCSWKKKETVLEQASIEDISSFKTGDSDTIEVSDATVNDITSGSRCVVVYSEPTLFCIKGQKDKQKRPTFTCWGYTMSITRVMVVPPSSEKGTGAQFLGFQTQTKSIEPPMKRARAEEEAEYEGLVD